MRFEHACPRELTTRLSFVLVPDRHWYGGWRSGGTKKVGLVGLKYNNNNISCFGKFMK
jgi:hypothetical protein